MAINTDTYNWSKYSNEPAEYSDINSIFISPHLHPPKALKSFGRRSLKIVKARDA